MFAYRHGSFNLMLNIRIPTARDGSPEVIIGRTEVLLSEKP
jgi:hypothetical protein